MSLTVKKKDDGDTRIIFPKGVLDIRTSPELEKELEDLDGVRTLILDMTSLEMVASAGFRVLIAAHKRMVKAGGTMKLIHVNAEIMKVCRYTGFADVMDITAD